MDTNIPNPQPVQPVVQGPVQGPVQPAATPEVKPPAKKSWLSKAIIGVVALVVVGGGTGWYFMGMPGLETAETPPTLELGGGQFQGKSIDSGYGSLKLDKTDVEDYVVPPGADLKTVSNGVQYFYAEEDVTMDKVIANIKPTVAGQNLLFTSFARLTPTAEPCFQIYPKGPYINTCEVGLDYSIPAGMVFAILSSTDVKFNSKLLKSAKTAPSKDYVSKYADSEGWVLLPIKDNNGLSHKNAKFTFILAEDNKFEEGRKLKNEYKVAWVYFEKDGYDASPPLAEPAVETEKVYCKELKITSPIDENKPGYLTITEDFDVQSSAYKSIEVSANGAVDTYVYKTSMGDHNIRYAGEEELTIENKNAGVSLFGGPRLGESVVITVTGYKQEGSALTKLEGCEAKLKVTGAQPTPPSLVDPPTLVLGGSVPTPPSLLMDKEYNCGNNKREGVLEVCDGDDLLGLTCATFDSDANFNGGTLSCSDSCLYWDATQCTETTEDASVMIVPSPIIVSDDPDPVVRPTPTTTISTDLREVEPLTDLTGTLTNIPTDNTTTTSAINVKELDSVVDYANPQIIQSNVVNGIDRDFFAIKTKQLGLYRILVYPELENGANVYGDGMAPSTNDKAVLAFGIPSGIASEFKLEYSGCFAVDGGTVPVVAPKLFLETDYLSNNAPIAIDANKNGVFGPSEFTGNDEGIESGKVYVVTMETEGSCTFGSDSGSVQFDFATANHDQLTTLEFK